MNYIDGCLVETLGDYSGFESVGALILGPDNLLKLTNEIDLVAQGLLITEDEQPLEGFDWDLYDIQDEEVFFYCPSGDDDQQVLLKNPIAWKCVDNPDEHNYYVTLKTFGLVCSMVAFRRLQLELMRKRTKRFGLKGAILGLLGRSLDNDIALFSDIIVKMDKALSQHLVKLRRDTNLNESEVEALEASFDKIMCIADNSV